MFGNFFVRRRKNIVVIIILVLIIILEIMVDGIIRRKKILNDLDNFNFVKCILFGYYIKYFFFSFGKGIFE